MLNTDYSYDATSLTKNSYFAMNNNMYKAIERLGTGLRINHAADDATGLGVADKHHNQVLGLLKARINAQDGVSFLQAGDSSMDSINAMLLRMRELSVQASSTMLTNGDRRMLQNEINSMIGEINRVSSYSEFNTKKLLSGSTSGLWSTNAGSVEAIIRGIPVDGNYKLSFSTEVGQNAVYNTRSLFDRFQLPPPDLNIRYADLIYLESSKHIAGTPPTFKPTGITFAAEGANSNNIAKITANSDFYAMLEALYPNKAAMGSSKVDLLDFILHNTILYDDSYTTQFMSDAAGMIFALSGVIFSNVLTYEHGADMNGLDGGGGQSGNLFNCKCTSRCIL